MQDPDALKQIPFKFWGRKVLELGIDESGYYRDCLMNEYKAGEYHYHQAPELDQVSKMLIASNEHNYDCVLVPDLCTQLKGIPLRRLLSEVWRVLKLSGTLISNWDGWNENRVHTEMRFWKYIMHYETVWAHERKLHDELPIKVGMHQDHALKIAKMTGRVIRRKKPEQIGKDSNGVIVKWFFSDCTLLLKRWAISQPYRVVDIAPKE